MKWTEITIFTTEEGADAVCARLDMLGVSQVMIEQGREEIAAFLRDTAKYWDFADMDELCAGEPCVKAYIADAGENAALINGIKASFEALKKEDVGIDLGSLSFLSRTVDEEDWANSWKVNYKPTPIGERLLIRPSWEDEYEAGGRAVLSIDPGMAFGTGTHETTRMCLEAIEKHTEPGCAALDLGCGSGILAIAALLLGADNALCVDIDPIAENIVRENARLNDIPDEKCEIAIGDILSNEALRSRALSKKYELITANIVASVIKALVPVIPGALAAGGVFITSGIIRERLDEVLRAMEENGLEAVEIHEDGEWRQITAKLK